jgi:4-hydroxybenzoate polyprenyltransferase
MVVLGGAGLATMAVLRPVLGGVGLVYLVINLSYSLGLKNMVLVDVLFVSSGYVIRAVAGAVAIGVNPSPWLYAVTAAGALFIVLGRRYAEVRLAGEEAARQRPVLSAYAGPLVSQLLGIAATAALVSYTLYTVEAEALPANNTMLLTVPLVTFGLFRYLYLLNTSAEAESPEQLITRDIPLVLAILSWVGLSALVLLLNS